MKYVNQISVRRNKGKKESIERVDFDDLKSAVIERGLIWKKL